MDNDNLSEKLSQLLNDPEGMARIQSMAQSLLGGESQSSAPSQQSGLSGNDMDMIMRAASLLKSDQGDDRSKLLLALKPHLSSSRRERVDKAVKLLRLANVMPLLSESDIFKL